MVIKFLPFDDDDLKRLDKLIKQAEFLEEPDRRARWRIKNRRDPEKVAAARESSRKYYFKQKDLERRKKI